MGAGDWKYFGRGQPWRIRRSAGRCLQKVDSGEGRFVTWPGGSQRSSGMSSAILVRDDANLKITFTKEAAAQKEAALTCAALIGRVTNAAENQTAVDAQTALKTIISTVEKARAEVKAPVLEYG